MYLIMIICLSSAFNKKSDKVILPDFELNDNVIFVSLNSVAEKIQAEISNYDNTIFICNYDNSGSSITIEIGSEHAKICVPYHIDGKITDKEIKDFLSQSGNQDLVNDIKHFGVENIDGDLLQQIDIDLLTKPYIRENSIMVPVSFVSEHLNCLTIFNRNGINFIGAGATILDNKKIFSVQVENQFFDTHITNKTVVNQFADMIKHSRQEKIEKPNDVTLLTGLGSTFKFMNEKDDVVSAWQFFIQNSEIEKTYDWDLLYLYDCINNIWYNVDTSVYYEYMYGEQNLVMFIKINYDLP